MYSINGNNCGIRPLVSNQTVTKIVGGVQAINGDWPWQIILFYKGNFYCGGSLINSMWVLTAGRYFSRLKYLFLRIVTVDRSFYFQL